MVGPKCLVPCWHKPHFPSKGLLEGSLPKPLAAEGYWHCFVSPRLSVLFMVGGFPLSLQPLTGRVLLPPLTSLSAPAGGGEEPGVTAGSRGATAGFWTGSSSISLQGESEVGREGRSEGDRKWAQRSLGRSDSEEELHKKRGKWRPGRENHGGENISLIFAQGRRIPPAQSRTGRSVMRSSSCVVAGGADPACSTAVTTCQLTPV